MGVFLLDRTGGHGLCVCAEVFTPSQKLPHPANTVNLYQYRPEPGGASSYYTEGGTTGNPYSDDGCAACVDTSITCHSLHTLSTSIGRPSPSALKNSTRICCARIKKWVLFCAAPHKYQKPSNSYYTPTFVFPSNI